MANVLRNKFICILVAVMSVAITHAEEVHKTGTNQITNTTSVRPIPYRPNASIQNCPTPSYPVEAATYELEGTILIYFLVGPDGMVKSHSIKQSTSWKILDDATVRALSNCQFEKFEESGKPSSYWTGVRYVWQMVPGDIGTKPVLQPETCQQLSDFFFAPDDDVRSDIRLRFRVSSKGKPFGIKVENTSGSAEADQAAAHLIESCQYSPSIHNGKPWDGSSSIRLFWLNNKVARERLRTDSALATYKEHYSSGHEHKAFAQSENGMWTADVDQADVELAKTKALDGCNARLKPGEKPCELINIDGKWQDQVSSINPEATATGSGK